MACASIASGGWAGEGVPSGSDAPDAAAEGKENNLSLGPSRISPAGAREAQSPPAESEEEPEPRHPVLLFVRHPSQEGLKAVEEACNGNLLAPDIMEDFVRELENRPSELGVQALLKIRMRCSDGSAADDIENILGARILLQRPDWIIRALAREGAEDPIFQDIAYAEGEKEEEGLFEYCDKKCVPEINRFYRRKAQVVRAAKMGGARERRAQRELLEAIEMVREDWVRRVSE